MKDITKASSPDLDSTRGSWIVNTTGLLLKPIKLPNPKK
jgi:hypothetical protein